MVTALPYVLIVLFALDDGSIMTMRTAQGFASPLTCSMRAFLENETARGRTYVCVTRESATALAGEGIGVATAKAASAEPGRDAGDLRN